VRDIEDRLQGKYPKSKGLPLSIEGQVDDLIKVHTHTPQGHRIYRHLCCVLPLLSILDRQRRCIHSSTLVFVNPAGAKWHLKLLLLCEISF